MSEYDLSRRAVIRVGLAGAGGVMLSGCDRLNQAPAFRSALIEAGSWHEAAQRAIIGDSLAREFSPADMSPHFRANGSTSVEDPVWKAHAARGFADWTLRVDGLVRRPLDLPLTALYQIEQRSQITRHDCVEGWSAIGQWQGPALGSVLALAGVLPAARFAVFHCADRLEGKPYYESLDLAEAFHPQTILAWRMNGRALPTQYGAPLRLRAERQLGYKHAKYVMRVELVSAVGGLYGGKGGYWEDARDYAWWAGI